MRIENPSSSCSGALATAACANAQRGRHPREPSVVWYGLIGLILLFCMPILTESQENATVDPRNVEAAFLLNFARYVTWPPDAFADDRSPWRICVLGSDPFGEVLDKTFMGRTEQGRPFVIVRTDKLPELKSCQIVYVAYKVSMSRRAVLAELDDLPVLTVSNAPGFLKEGGIIRFDVKDFVAMSVNLDKARAASLSIQTKMLEVSNDVIENGKVHKVR